MATITVQNLTQVQQALRAYDGTVTLVPGSSIAVVDQKFGWALDLAIFKLIVPAPTPNLPYTNSLVFELHGTNGSTIPTGSLIAVDLPYSAAILRVSAYFDQIGSITFDLWKCLFGAYPTSSASSMTGGVGITLTSQQSYQDTELLNFTTTNVNQYDVLTLVVDSISSYTWGTINLGLSRIGTPS